MNRTLYCVDLMDGQRGMSSRSSLWRRSAEDTIMCFNLAFWVTKRGRTTRSSRTATTAPMVAGAPRNNDRGDGRLATEHGHRRSRLSAWNPAESRTVEAILSWQES